MNEITTTNLAEFGYHGRKQLIPLLEAWCENELPEDFSNDNVHAMFNKNSGSVFLTNGDYDVCMMNGVTLETWYNCGNCGHEGFAEDCQLNEDGCNECKEGK